MRGDVPAAVAVAACFAVGVALSAAVATVVPDEAVYSPPVTPTQAASAASQERVPATKVLDSLGGVGGTAFTPVGCDVPAPFDSVVTVMKDGVLVVTNVYGAGLGGLVAERCTNVTVLRRGDVVMFPWKESSAAADALAALDIPECKDDNGGQSRNPYWGGEFVGAVRYEMVRATVPLPEVSASPVAAEELPVVSLPVVPDFPHSPDLPKAVAVPVFPELPKYPEASADVALRVRDEVGPGCGWAFTGLAEPPFDEAQVEAANDEALRVGREKLNASINGYAEAVSRWRVQYERYRKDVAAYRAYAAEVADVAAQWDAQRAEYVTYLAEVEEYRRELAEYEAYQSAANEYAQLQAFCSSLTEFEVSDSCPAVEPEILLSPAPTVPVEPTR